MDVAERTPGSQAVYTCDAGFAPNGLIIRTCSGSGQWTGQQDTQCIDRTTIVCPQLPAPVNGGVVITMNGLGGRAIYSCDLGFSPDGGLIVRACMANEEWSETPPTCERKDKVKIRSLLAVINT